MSLIPTSGIGHIVAGVQAAQGRGDPDRAAQEIGSQQRVSQLAAGAEQVNGEASTHERDADGRLPYQQQNTRQKSADGNEAASDADPSAPLPKDPTGQTGTTLDLTG
ncbi:MAG: hypothetical protein AB7O62_16635 [Pirellulales bacterium]